MFLARDAQDSTAPTPAIALRLYPASADAELIATEIDAMSSSSGAALPALLDVATLHDGRVCMAVERISGPSLASVLIHRRLDPGETVTVLAPIVDAQRRLLEQGFVHTRLSPADVLIDSTGRPRLVGLGAIRRLPRHGLGQTSAVRDACTALLSLVDALDEASNADLGPVAAALQERIDLVALNSVDDELERTVFAVAPATALRETVDRGRQSSSRAHSTPAEREPTPYASARQSHQFDALAQLPVGTLEALDPIAGERGLVSRVRIGLLKRRRVLVFGSLIAGALVIGMLTVVPPANGVDTSTNDPGAEATEISFGAEIEPDPEPVVGAGSAPPDDATAIEVGDPIAAARELLAARAECIARLDTACIERFAQDGSPIVVDDVALIARARNGEDVSGAFDPGSIAVVGEMGGAVLLSVEFIRPERHVASLLLMRSEATWRLRDLFD